MKQYRLKVDNIVWAEKLTADNGKALAREVGGKAEWHGRPGDITDGHFKFYFPTLDGREELEMGQYLVKGDTGRLTARGAAEFEEKYEPIANAAPTAWKVR